MLVSIDPASGKLIKEYQPLTPQEVNSRLQIGEKIFDGWRLSSLDKRSALLDHLSQQLTKDKNKLSLLITQEMGKPLNQSIQEIEKCIAVCRYYSEYGKLFLKDKEEFLSYKKSLVCFLPLGGVLGIMPWNFPFWQVLRFAVPALLSGNVVFLKHAENVQGCALALENLFLDSSWPAGVFNTLPIEKDLVEDVIKHPFIKMVSFTGSQAVGRHIGALCGKYIKKSCMELGGSDPYIVLKDADLQKAAEQTIESRLNNSGQSCIAAKRVIIEARVYDDFCLEIQRLMSLKTISTPIYNPHVGPLAKKELVDQLTRYKEQALEQGAEVLFEKHPSEEDSKKGFYFPICALKNCYSNMLVAKEEVFGPLLPLFSVDDEEQACQLANQTHYGLGACIFTKNEAKGEVIAKDLIFAGSCFINERVRSHPALPFGGINQSGYGRELSEEGIKEFVNVKTVVTGY